MAAHADDEILGAGGALAMHAASGDELTILILSTSIHSRAEDDHAAAAAHRRRCAHDVAALYGAHLTLADLPDNRFDTLAHLDVVQHIETVIQQVRPAVVYTHCGVDLSRDHQIVAHATATATRPQPASPVRTVLGYEVRSATEWGPQQPFRPTWFQQLDPPAVERKLQALKIYDSEMRPWPHSRSLRAVEAQIAERGARVGVNAAEAFEVIRHLG